MKKAETLTKWRGLQPRQSILKHFRAIPYKAAGSKYGACGIRIDGTPEFVDAVLSHLQELLAGENSLTRLELARRPVVNAFKATPNAEREGEVCYIRLHERGKEAQIMNARYDRSMDEATEIFCNA